LKLDGDEAVGAGIIRRALEAPIRQISENAGVDGAIVVQAVRADKREGFGFNAATAEYEDLVAAGVIDPTKVVRTALQNAASVATLLLTTDALITEVKEEKPAGAHAPSY
jgi:chaperonin GroEL